MEKNSNSNVSISCYKECSNPVIGSCIGYRNPCNRFMCKKHGVDIVCEDCFNDAAWDVVVDDAYRRYAGASWGLYLKSKHWYHKLITSVGRMSFVLALVGVLDLLCLRAINFQIYSSKSDLLMLGVGIFVFGLITLWWMYFVDKPHENRLIALKAEMPGITTFYNEGLMEKLLFKDEKLKRFFYNKPGGISECVKFVQILLDHETQSELKLEFFRPRVIGHIKDARQYQIGNTAG